jgi:transcriptional regulator with XRE-family HTH domain
MIMSEVGRAATERAAKLLGAYLRGLRTQLGWTQASLGGMMRVDSVTRRRWELGIFSPSNSNPKRPAETYGLTLAADGSQVMVDPECVETEGLHVGGLYVARVGDRLVTIHIRIASRFTHRPQAGTMSPTSGS